MGGAPSTAHQATQSGVARPGPERPMSNVERLMAESEAEKRRKVAAEAPPPPPPASAQQAQQGTSSSGSAGGGGGAGAEEWLLPGIIVRVMNKSVAGGAYYKARGVVTKVIDTFAAHVRLDAGGAPAKPVTIKLDVADLETTCPPVGGEVIIVAVRGPGAPHRGRRGVVAAIHVEAFCADVEVQEQAHGTRTLLRGLEYEGFSRAA